MVEDTAGGDALPLLAYTLSELYKGVGSEHRITTEAYEAVGGVVGALRNRADALTRDLQHRGQGTRVLPTLVKLATVDGEGEPTARRIHRGDLDPDETAVVDAFIDARLLTSDGSRIEVAHEALLRQWGPLRDAIEEARAWLSLRSELERLTADWQHAHQDDSFLVRGTRLVR